MLARKTFLIVLLGAIGVVGCSLNDGPTISSISPQSGPQSGGTAVTINGTGFTDHTRVGIGGIEAEVIQNVDSGALTVLTPPAPFATRVDIVVRNRDGQKDQLKNGFTYGIASAGVVSITSIAPQFGPSGTLVTLTGTGFEVGATVTFGTQAALNVVVLSSTEVQCGAPPQPDGAVNVILQNPDGGQAQTSFSYGTGTGTGTGTGGGGGDTSGPKTISTVAGGATTGFAGDGGAATSALLAHPGGLAFGSDGTLYIADTGNNRVRTVTIANVISTIVGTGTAGFAGDGGGGSSAQLNGPTGLAVDESNNLYIADTGNHAIRKFAHLTGTLTTIAGTLGTAGNSGDGLAATAALFSGVNAVALDPSNNIYICDAGNHRVRAIEASTGFVVPFAGTGTPGFSGDGGPGTSAQLTSPSGIAYESVTARVYIADTGNARVRFIDSTGNIRPFCGGGTGPDGGPALSASLTKPVGLATDGGNNLNIADAGAQTVRQISLSSLTISTIAGQAGSAGFSGDGGPATSAQLNTPSALAANSIGYVWIADSGDGSVRLAK